MKMISVYGHIHMMLISWVVVTMMKQNFDEKPILELYENDDMDKQSYI